MVILEFWATWCGPCRAVIPHLAELNERYRGQGLMVLSVTSEQRGPVEPFARQNNMVWNIGIDSDGSTSGTYGVQGIPHGLIIATDGRVLWEGHPGNLPEDTLRTALRNVDPSYAITEGHAYSEAMNPVLNELRQQHYAKAVERAKALA